MYFLLNIFEIYKTVTVANLFIACFFWFLGENEGEGEKEGNKANTPVMIIKVTTKI